MAETLEIHHEDSHTLQNIINQHELRWIFVGGKGGVGKTTTSCGLAIQLSKTRESVLLISTDPAHNLSDALSQKFCDIPSVVNGIPNLFAMEIDPSASIEGFAGKLPLEEGESDPSFLGLFKKISVSIPGIDEAVGFCEVMKLIKNMSYSVVVFDTAPTGHTLRFLNFPSLLKTSLNKLFEISGPFRGVIQQLLGGVQNGDMMGKIKELQDIVEEIHKQFTDPNRTTFISVCISEFLSLYETERMIQELANLQIDTRAIVVNQIVFPELSCKWCTSRRKRQNKYLEQIYDLYDDFDIVLLPSCDEEIRGPKKLEMFSKYMLKPYMDDMVHNLRSYNK